MFSYSGTYNKMLKNGTELSKWKGQQNLLYHNSDLLLAFNYFTSNIRISISQCKQFCEFRNLLLYLPILKTTSSCEHFHAAGSNNLESFLSENPWLRTFSFFAIGSLLKISMKHPVCVHSQIHKHIVNVFWHLATSFIFIESSVVWRIVQTSR